MTHDIESRGLEEVSCMHVVWPMQPLVLLNN